MMEKKGVSMVSGNAAPKVGEQYTYQVTGWYPATQPSERNAVNVTWELFKKRKNGKFTTTNIRKKGISSFTFGEKAAGSTYRLEGYLYQPEGIGLIIKPVADEIPRIHKVELLYVDDSPGKVFSFQDKLRAKAYCSNLFGKNLRFTLWEDDAKGAGHDPKNLIVAQTDKTVDKNGNATVDFVLSSAIMQKAMRGETDLKHLEFYVTVEYYAHKKHATDNVNVTTGKQQGSKSAAPAAEKEQAKAKESPAQQKGKSKKEEKGIFETIVGYTEAAVDYGMEQANTIGKEIYDTGKDAAEAIWNAPGKLVDYVEAKGKAAMDALPKFSQEETKTAANVGGADAPKENNCGEKYCIKKGDKSELVREINIRLAGFGGNVPTDEFTDQTESMIKQFQRDYMKVPETGKVCGNVLRAIDEFQGKYSINFEDVKCPCGKCKGFGNGLFDDQKQNAKIAELHRKYEYPGIHRSLIWALRSAMFYTSDFEKTLNYTVKCIFSGYRCHENNRQHKRSSTNHMGKALDIHFNKSGKRTQIVKEVEEIRQKIFVKHLGNQVRWAATNKFSLEPGIANYKGEFTASTWIHFDVRQFELQFLDDKFFVKTLNGVNGESIVALAEKTNPQTCKCAGSGTPKKISAPASIPKKTNNGFTVEDGRAALRTIYDKYGKDMAIIIERMYRDETAHFNSGQYKACGTGGMEVFGPAPYYGWDASFFEEHPEYRPVGVWSAYENKGMSGQGGNKQVTDRKKEFVVLPSVLAGMEYKVYYINKHGGNWARWHSTSADTQENYREYLSKIKPKFVEEFEKP